MLLFLCSISPLQLDVVPSSPSSLPCGLGGPRDGLVSAREGAFIATTALLFVLGPYGVVLRPNLHVHVLRPRGPVSIT